MSEQNLTLGFSFRVQIGRNDLIFVDERVDDVDVVVGVVVGEVEMCSLTILGGHFGRAIIFNR